MVFQTIWNYLPSNDRFRRIGLDSMSNVWEISLCNLKNTKQSVELLKPSCLIFLLKNSPKTWRVNVPNFFFSHPGSWYVDNDFKQPFKQKNQRYERPRKTQLFSFRNKIPYEHAGDDYDDDHDHDQHDHDNDNDDEGHDCDNDSNVVRVSNCWHVFGTVQFRWCPLTSWYTNVEIWVAPTTPLSPFVGIAQPGWFL